MPARSKSKNQNKKEFESLLKQNGLTKKEFESLIRKNGLTKKDFQNMPEEKAVVLIKTMKYNKPFPGEPKYDFRNRPIDQGTLYQMRQRYWRAEENAQREKAALAKQNEELKQQVKKASPTPSKQAAANKISQIATPALKNAEKIEVKAVQIIKVPSPSQAELKDVKATLDNQIVENKKVESEQKKEVKKAEKKAADAKKVAEKTPTAANKKKADVAKMTAEHKKRVAALYKVKVDLATKRMKRLQMAIKKIMKGTREMQHRVNSKSFWTGKRRSKSGSKVTERKASKSGSKATKRKASKSGSKATKRKASKSGSKATKRKASKSGSKVTKRKASKSGSKVTKRKASKSGSKATKRKASKSGSKATKRKASKSGSKATKRKSSKSGSKDTKKKKRITSGFERMTSAQLQQMGISKMPRTKTLK